MTIYQGHEFTTRITSEEAIQRDAYRLGAELRKMMGYDEAVYFLMNSGNNLRDMVRKAEDKVAQMKACDHVWITPITGSVKFTGGEVDDDVQAGSEYCPLCGMVKPEQPAEMVDAELPI